MKKFIALLFLISINFGFNSSELPKGIQKKITKEIKIIFEVENFSLEAVIVTDQISEQLITSIDADNLFKIIVDSNLIGYAFVSKALSKTDSFDYLVLFDTDLIIKKSKILIYREDYGAEIGSKRWLKQFIGLNEKSNVEYGNEIKAISGATISARSFTIAINNLLKSVNKLREEKII